VNDVGRVVGSFVVPSGETRPFRWENGVMTPLPTLGGPSNNVARGINNRGQVVGTSTDRNRIAHAVLWDKGTIVDLGTLGNTYAWANAINERGQVVGLSGLPNQPPYNQVAHAVLWQNGMIRDLGALGSGSSEAFAINDHGQVVGSATGNDGLPHAFIISAQGPEYDFVPPGPQPSGALQPYLSNALGNRDRNVIFEANMDVAVSAIGVRIDPLTFGVSGLSVGIWEIKTGGGPLNLGTRPDPPLKTATLKVTDAGLAFYDVPIAFTFLAGHRYCVGFSPAGTSAGWGTNTNMEFYHFGMALAVNPPYRDSRPFTIGNAFTVLHGGYGDDFSQESLPHIRLMSQ
jgi:probable HAF family extracellular repeat protein